MIIKKVKASIINNLKLSVPQKLLDKEPCSKNIIITFHAPQLASTQ